MTMFETPVRPSTVVTAAPRRGATVKLFCLPHAGAGASAYARWPAAFGGSMDVHAIQLPGRENRIMEEALVDPDAVAATILGSTTGPFALYGHSMGARLAFEVVRSLRRAGARLPEVLYVSGCRSPDITGGGVLDGLSLAEDEEFIARLCDGGGLPAEVLAEEELLELLLPTLRADFTWLDGYTFQDAEPLPIPIVCFAGDQDMTAPLHEMDGWAAQTSAGFTLHVLPGGHFFPRDNLAEMVKLIHGALPNGRPATASASVTAAPSPAPAPALAVIPVPAPVQARAEHRVPLGRWSVWRDAILRTTGFPAEGLDRFTAPECAVAADAWLASGGDRAAFDACFDEAAAAGSQQIREIAADPLFREAVTWQNPSMRHTLDGLSSGTHYRPTVARHRESTVLRYWQRYCAKNETIGFFGPVCWARVDASMPELVEARPGPALIRRRRVALESWAVQAFADFLAADPALRPWLRPRRQPHLAIVGRAVHWPPRPDRVLSPAELAVMTACDGQRTAAEVARSLGPRLDDGYLLMERLVETGLLRWDFDIPTEPGAEPALVAQIGAIGDPAVRDRAAASLRVLQDARDAVAAAAGDPEALGSALYELGKVFTDTTGEMANRRPGEHYAGRHLCYEDTVRDLDVRFGAGLLDAVVAPLDLVLRAARWLCAELAEVHTVALRELYDELAGSQGGKAVNLAELWFLAQGMFFGEEDRPADAAVESFHQRWETLFRLAGADRDDVAQVDLSAAEMAPHFESIFPERGPGWSAGRLHSPDLLLCAASTDALNRGEFSVVLGEMHTAWPTFDNALFADFHPEPRELVDALAADLGPNRMRLLYPTDWPRGAGRLAPVLAGPTDGLLGFTPAPGALPDRLVPAATLLVSEDAAGELTARAPDGRSWPLLEVFGPLLATKVVDGFEILGGRPHTPRVTLDRLVVAREAWRTTVAATGLAKVTGDSERFLAARRWRARLGLPERVFVRVGTETKPTYVDFRSPLYVRALASLLRTAAETGGEVTVGVTEMLPTPEQAWVVDGDGNRYFSELRLQVSDHG